MRAFVRAYLRVVSTISAAINHGGSLRNSDEPGWMLNFVPRAPVYSCGSVLWPTFDNRPASSARWIASCLRWSSLAGDCADIGEDLRAVEATHQAMPMQKRPPVSRLLYPTCETFIAPARFEGIMVCGRFRTCPPDELTPKL